jgi:hypothetical protein
LTVNLNGTDVSRWNPIDENSVGCHTHEDLLNSAFLAAAD